MRKTLRFSLIKISNFFNNIANKINFRSVKILNSANNKYTVQLQSGIIYVLHPGEHVDDQIIQYGCFEPFSTNIVKTLIHPGMTIIDVGANFGYYSCLFSKLVGSTGHVFCFEPTNYFRQRLVNNIYLNNYQNITVSEYALSDCHWVPDFDSSQDMNITNENISTITLDEFLSDKNIQKIDFIKVDIDGHELKFIKGAMYTISKYKPKILMEISPIHLNEAGYNMQDCWDIIQEINYNVKHEKDLNTISNFRQFLYRCGNFSESVNILLEPKL